MPEADRATHALNLQMPNNAARRVLDRSELARLVVVSSHGCGRFAGITMGQSPRLWSAVIVAPPAIAIASATTAKVLSNNLFGDALGSAIREECERWPTTQIEAVDRLIVAQQ